VIGFAELGNTSAYLHCLRVSLVVVSSPIVLQWDARMALVMMTQRWGRFVVAHWVVGTHEIRSTPKIASAVFSGCIGRACLPTAHSYVRFALAGYTAGLFGRSSAQGAYRAVADGAAVISRARLPLLGVCSVRSEWWICRPLTGSAVAARFAFGKVRQGRQSASFWWGTSQSGAILVWPSRRCQVHEDPRYTRTCCSAPRRSERQRHLLPAGLAGYSSEGGNLFPSSARMDFRPGGPFCKHYDRDLQQRPHEQGHSGRPFGIGFARGNTSANKAHFK